jgi:methionyl aminopeptidase
MIALKTVAELEIMRQNGAVLASILQELCEAAVPGQTTGFLDRLAEKRIRESGGEPAFPKFAGFPGAINASLNDEVVHGIPTDDRRLRRGDVFSIDIGLVRRGFCADAATTIPIGEVAPEVKRLLDVGEMSLWKGIEQVRIGNRLSDVSHAIGSYVEEAGFHVVREYVGHGIGRALHEDPQIPNYGPPGRGVRLCAGMTFAIEPMVKIDALPTAVREDRWTVVTGSGGLSVHYEHTVALTEEGVEVLTCKEVSSDARGNG